MQLAGVPDSIIQTHGRWLSDAYRVYFDIQNSSEMRRLATSMLRDRQQPAAALADVRR